MAFLKLKYILPGHLLLLHCLSSVDNPEHSLGPLQVLILLWVPPPQVRVQSEKGAHSPHVDSSKSRNFVQVLYNLIQ